jgi:hypothetical protein
MFKYLFLVSFALNVLAAGVWYTTNHHPSDVLDDCMAVSDKAQTSLVTCEKYLKVSVDVMTGMKEVVEGCVKSMKRVVDEIKNKRSEK